MVLQVLAVMEELRGSVGEDTSIDVKLLPFFGGRLFFGSGGQILHSSTLHSCFCQNFRPVYRAWRSFSIPLHVEDNERLEGSKLAGFPAWF